MVNAKSKYSFLYSLDLDQDVIERLSRHLERTEEGSNEVFVTPMAKEYSPELLLEEFDKVFDSNRSLMNETLINLELSNKAKVGPRSIAKPWSERKENFLSGFGNPELSKSVDFLPNIGKGRLRPLATTTALTLLKNNTNSGLPYYTKKGKVKERVLDKYDSLLDRRDPCILFTRTQEQMKTRDVWGYPIADTLFEMCYYSPLLAYQKALIYRAALISPDEVSRRITQLIDKCNVREMMLVSLDIARFDQSAKSKLQKVAFNYIKSLYQATYHSEIDRIQDRFKSIGIVTPSGVLTGDHGIPSGSTFTNEVGSIIQYSVGTSLPFVDGNDIQVQGDDGVYLVPKDKVDELFKQFESCGLQINRDKSYQSNNYVVYLQNLFHSDYRKDGIIGGIYPIYRALNRIMYQERWSDFEDYGVTGKDYYSIRTICIVENCKHHPLFRELVKFILRYDKYSLDISDQGVTSYVHMISSSYGAGEILNNQYGDNVGGIKSFETYKLIKELS